MYPIWAGWLLCWPLAPNTNGCQWQFPCWLRALIVGCSGPAKPENPLYRTSKCLSLLEVRALDSPQAAMKKQWWYKIFCRHWISEELGYYRLQLIMPHWNIWSVHCLKAFPSLWKSSHCWCLQEWTESWWMHSSNLAELGEASWPSIQHFCTSLPDHRLSQLTRWLSIVNLVVKAFIVSDLRYPLALAQHIRLTATTPIFFTEKKCSDKFTMPMDAISCQVLAA